MEYQLIQSPDEVPGLSAVETILLHRGIKPNDIEHYLSTTMDDLYDVSLIDNLEEGARLLVRHLSQNNDMFVQVDADCDGFTSAAAFINYLWHIAPAYVENHVYYRVHDQKQHGIILDTIPETAKLIVVPDAGSSDYDEHRALKSQGKDVLVIDHHQADYISPDACIINNQLCDYPNKSLSGVGMVYKFCCYLDQLLKLNYSKTQLDLVAIGLCADMIDLHNYETKYLITEGLENINSPFVKEILEMQSYSINRHGQYDPFSISFYIAPLVNAMIRTGGLKEKLNLFESMLEFKGYQEIPSTKTGCFGQMETRAAQACRECSNAKSRQTRIRDNNLTTIKNIIESENLLDLSKILIIRVDAAHAIDTNLTGLIANQLMAEYQRPVLLLNEVRTIVTDAEGNQFEQISWAGSGRGYEKSKLKDFRKFLDECEFVEYSQGHAQAFGAEVLDKNFDKFLDDINKRLKDFEFTPCYRVDIIYQGNNFKGKDILDIASLSPHWGQGIEEPMICIENINVTKDNIQLLSRDKNPTLKIKLANGVDLMKFKSSEEEYETLCSSDYGSITMNIVGKCNQNSYGGILSPQIVVEAYEITGSQQFYF